MCHSQSLVVREAAECGMRMTQWKVIAGNYQIAQVTGRLCHRNEVQLVPRLIQPHLRIGMVADRNHKVALDIRRFLTNLCRRLRVNDALAKDFNDPA